MRFGLIKRLSLFKALLAVALGIYLATLSFVFGYLLWQSVTIHLVDATIQMAILAALAFLATVWGGYVASWFNYYRNCRLLGLCVGGSMYAAALLFLATGPEDFLFILPFAKDINAGGFQAAIPPMLAGALGGWLADRLHSRQHSTSQLP